MSPFVKETRVVYYTNGAAIRAAREAKGISLRQAASALGVSPSYLSRIERETITSLPALTLQAFECLFLGEKVTK